MTDEQQNANAAADLPGEEQHLEWAPAERRRRRRWPWIVAPAVLVVAAATVVSTIFIAPGVSAAGIPVGGMTRDGAVSAIEDHVSQMAVTFSSDAGDETIPATELGATVDAEKLADRAHGSYPLWNIGGWGSDEITADVALDDESLVAALHKKFPSAFADAVDATIGTDGEKFVVTESMPGRGIDLDQVKTALQDALNAGNQHPSVPLVATEIAPAVSDKDAAAAAKKLNGMLKDVGFYVGDERTVPVDATTMAKWLSFSFENGELQITADRAAIQKSLKQIADDVNRKPRSGRVITDTDGNVLATEVEGVEGRTLGDIDDLGKTFAAQLEKGETKLALPVKTVEPKIETLERKIDLNLKTQTVRVYENGELVKKMLTSTGLAPNETHTGEFKITAHVPVQDMGCGEGWSYCTKDVPWIMYWDWSDEAFHGTYWHNNFGNPMSHGCANLSEADAKWLYDWTPDGTPVSVHY